MGQLKTPFASEETHNKPICPDYADDCGTADSQNAYAETLKILNIKLELNPQFPWKLAGLSLFSRCYGMPVFFNLFLDPQVIDPNRFFVSNQSPCIDAGDPAISDECFAFSMGTAFSDIGAYGGPSACGWLLDAFAPRVEIQTFVGLSFTGLVNHTYSIEYVTNVNATNWTGLATNSLTQPVW